MKKNFPEVEEHYIQIKRTHLVLQDNKLKTNQKCPYEVSEYQEYKEQTKASREKLPFKKKICHLLETKEQDQSVTVFLTGHFRC